ncbi:MAG: helix-turn-helix domain-containing protein, partial [Peptostreptococcaceae bacterium]
MENQKIGNKISEYRRIHNLTIKEFSEQTNLSAGLISQLERGMGNPSLSALQSIASALNISLSSLFEEEVSNESLILRKEDRETIYNPDQKHVLYDVLTPSPLNSSVELLLMNLSANSKTYGDFSTHVEEELAFILDGEVSIVFEHEEFLLREGDTIRILPNRGHKFKNSTDKDIKVLFIKS